MSIADYDYDLPAEAIAQHPVEPRSSARLLVATAGDQVEHRTVADLPSLLAPGDVLVLNETKVLPARLRLRKATGGEAEVLLLEPATADPAAGEWLALVRPGRRLPPGTDLYAPPVAEAADPAEAGPPVVTVGAQVDADGTRCVRLHDPAVLDVHGAVPLPPYITEPLADADRYQTVYARLPGSVAAPTAGLHLTDEVLDACRRRGVDVVTVDLKVGLGTFKPIAVADVADHVMHEERYAVPTETLARCHAARAAGGRVVAVGTTSVRALESAARGEPQGRTRLFITPGFDFRLVDVLLTNFHTPKSSLLVLLAAFVGTARWRSLYDEALANGYRFLSFGDAMLVARRTEGTA